MDFQPIIHPRRGFAPNSKGNQTFFHLPPYNGVEYYIILPSAIAILPNYRGLKGEKLYTHFVVFEIACSFVNEQSLSLDVYHLRLLSFSLEGDTIIWLATLKPDSIAIWNSMFYAFIRNYFPPKITINIQQEIFNFTMEDNKYFYITWKRFKALLNNTQILGCNN